MRRELKLINIQEITITITNIEIIKTSFSLFSSSFEFEVGEFSEVNLTEDKEEYFLPPFSSFV